MHFRNGNFKHKMTSNPEKVVYEKFYVHEIAAVDLSKIYFLKRNENIWTKQPRFKSRLKKSEGPLCSDNGGRW